MGSPGGGADHGAELGGADQSLGQCYKGTCPSGRLRTNGCSVCFNDLRVVLIEVSKEGSGVLVDLCMPAMMADVAHITELFSMQADTRKLPWREGHARL